jgi:hypothetical protein
MNSTTTLASIGLLWLLLLVALVGGGTTEGGVATVAVFDEFGTPIQDCIDSFSFCDDSECDGLDWKLGCHAMTATTVVIGIDGYIPGTPPQQLAHQYCICACDNNLDGPMMGQTEIIDTLLCKVPQYAAAFPEPTPNRCREPGVAEEADNNHCNNGVVFASLMEQSAVPDSWKDTNFMVFGKKQRNSLIVDADYFCRCTFGNGTMEAYGNPPSGEAEIEDTEAMEKNSLVVDSSLEARRDDIMYLWMGKPPATDLCCLCIPQGSPVLAPGQFECDAL